jgi:hypothetical protein
MVQIWKQLFCKVLDRPAVKWAQRKTNVFLTVEATDLAQEGRVIQLTPEGHLVLKGSSTTTSRQYELEIDLYDSVIVEQSKWKVTDFAVTFNISKGNKEGGHWPRLLKQTGKFKWLSCDWNKWVDEDEEDESAQPNFGDMGDMDDFPDEEDEDSDDEQEADLADIEAPAEQAPVEEAKSE